MQTNWKVPMERLNCLVVYSALAIFLLPAAYNGQLPTPTPQPCTNVDCGRGTTCMQVEGTPVCVSVNESTCEANPCASGGFCVPDEVMGFICECLEGLTGPLCDGQLNASSTCLDLDCGDGTCVLVNDTTPVCMCSPGLSGRNCSVELNPCDSDPCLNGGTCSNDDQQPTCQCPNDFTGSFCEAPIVSTGEFVGSYTS